MLDIKLFRGRPEIVRKSQRRRFANIELVDEVIALDEQARKRKNFPSLYPYRVYCLEFSLFIFIYLFIVIVKFELDNLRKDFNNMNRQIAQLKIVSLLFSFENLLLCCRWC